MNIRYFSLIDKSKIRSNCDCFRRPRSPREDSLILKDYLQRNRCKMSPVDTMPKTPQNNIYTKIIFVLNLRASSHIYILLDSCLVHLRGHRSISIFDATSVPL